MEDRSFEVYTLAAYLSVLREVADKVGVTDHPCYLEGVAEM